jgi:GT2 family glycosyltransferase
VDLHLPYNRDVTRPARVSFVLVNWNTEATLPAALSSVAAQSVAPHQVILVNNGSPAWNPQILAEQPQVELIDLKRNVGFAEGNNIGLRRCDGDIVVLVNCDAALDRAFAEQALVAFDEFPKVGSVAPKLLLGTAEVRSQRIDSAGHVMRTDRTATNRGHGELDQGQYDKPAWIFGASAAVVAYRRDMLDSIIEGSDYFDRDFFAYYEDVDLDWRAQLAGWQALYWPKCVAYHLGHGSGGRRSWLIRARAEKNRYLMLAKNDSVSAQVTNAGALLAYELWHFFQALKSLPQLVGMLLALWFVPGAVAKRLRRRTVCSADQVSLQFLPRGPIPPLPGPTTQGLDFIPKVEPSVTVVLVNFKGYALTAAALEGLRSQDHQPLEVIVVDNASQERQAERLKKNYPEARVLRMEDNLGFAAAANWGAHVAGGEWLVFLNNDAIPDSSCLRRLVECQQRTEAWAVSGRLIDLKSAELVGPALSYLREAELGQAAPEWLFPAELRDAIAESNLNHGLSWYGYPVRNSYGDNPECFYPSGGLFCIPRSTLDHLGTELFRHHWFAYYEDVELGFRIRGAGGWVAKEPKAVAVHLASSTARKLGSFKLAYLRERNRLATLRIWLPDGAFLRLAPIMLSQCVAAFLWLLMTRPVKALGFGAAHLWCMAHFAELTRLHWLAKPCDGLLWPRWSSQLSGRIRGGAGLANQIALGWARRWRVPVLEDTIPPRREPNGLAEAQAKLPVATSDKPGPPDRATLPH